MRRLLATASIAATFALDASAQSSGLFWWIVDIQKSERIATAETRTVALYGAQSSLDFKWIFKNDEDDDQIALSPAAIQEAVRVSEVAVPRTIEVMVSWAPTGKGVLSGSPVPIAANDTVGLNPGDWLEWEAVVRRQDSSPWAPGEYQFVIDMSAAIATLRTNGARWRGRASREMVITVKIAPLNSAAARKAAARLDGSHALVAGDTATAIRHYRAMIQADPSDWEGHAGLGKALLAARQYKEAAAELERALPLALRGTSVVLPEQLAYAYVVLGDEANATRVLRLVVPPAEVPVRLNRLRTTARNC